ncbi:hypothetical protein BUALT_Bualt18G0126700 [Buddleja alternifolia]|uniref:TCP domain-containing protein n=1 Tax=Buddleja alternifolia TaxID=168488 RepID=A0AAV6W362_9LAMI|nr:hypothetical protein BUALT_Bualt18G0126700 [Buddleja alternifolia]
MEADQTQRKFARISNGNGRFVTATLDQISGKMDADEEDEGEHKRRTANDVVGVDLGGEIGRFYNWPSSRIVRVSRATGGKDRHSKVLTSKGLRDRRVRLSVNTAIELYDLQDRLGFDQPSKAVEWLLKAAASSITELPPMNTPFPDTPKQLSDEKRSSNQLGFDSAEVDTDRCYVQQKQQQQQQQQQNTKSSACSSTSETSKGSGLSLSRSETRRVKARERAKGRRAEAKDKDKDNESSLNVVSCLNPISQTTSFTELLNGGLNNMNNVNNIRPNNESNFFLKSPMDYFTSGLLGPPVPRSSENTHFAHSLKSTPSPLFSAARDHPSELQQFSFAPDYSNSNNNHHNGSSEYNLNFTISSSAAANSSGLADFNNRGTLQSNSSSPSLLPHLQRFPPIDRSSQSFFIGTTVPMENHHQLVSGFDAAGRLQLYYGDAHANNGRNAGHKGKGKH